MIRRFLNFFFVGTLGACIGVLFAPAPGVETRTSISVFFDKHDETIADFYTRGLTTVAGVADVVSSTVEAQVGETNLNNNEN